MATLQSFVLSPFDTKYVWVCWADHPEYWKVSPMPNSRFLQKAELLNVSWLQIRARIDTGALDRDTTYSVLFFFGYNEPVTGLETPSEVSLTQKDGQTICSRKVHLYPGSPDLIQQEREEWLALEVGRFQPSGVSREIVANLLDGTGQWKSGLVFAGVEIRAVPT